MEYIQGIEFQTRLFLYSVGFGFLLGILYDFFRTVRMLISFRKSFVIFSDISYFILCAFLVFCFSLVMDGGQVRAFVFAAQALGWLIYYFSFGAVAVRFGNALLKLKKRMKKRFNISQMKFRKNS